MLRSNAKSNGSLAQKLRVDFRRVGGRSVDMDDTDELIIRLCTQVGMIMEDSSILALTLGAVSRSEWTDAIADLGVASGTIERLIEAARALCR
jgi:hypothetical protein